MTRLRDAQVRAGQVGNDQPNDALAMAGAVVIGAVIVAVLLVAALAWRAFA